MMKLLIELRPSRADVFEPCAAAGRTPLFRQAAALDFGGETWSVLRSSHRAECGRVMEWRH